MPDRGDDTDDGGMPTSTLDHLADATPQTRTRSVDLLRVISIAVVVLWHCTMSVVHWRDGRITMPNPIESVDGLWLATWILQVMPVFFIVGGFANAAAFRAATRAGVGHGPFLRRRAQRLVAPLAPMIGFWLLADAALIGSGATDRSVWQWGDVVFVPLWFIGAYLIVTASTPWARRAEDRWGWGAVLALGAAIAAVDAIRFVAGVSSAGLLNSILVFVFAAQLGHRWQAGATRHHRGVTALTALVVGLVGLAVLTTSAGYPPSMVATDGAAFSNMFPTTAAIAALALLQFGLIAACEPALERLAHRPRVWRATIAANAMAMTVFTWHMTALVGAITVWTATGHGLEVEATATWWRQRPVFIALPAVMLVPFLATFGTREMRTLTGPSRR
ncbi:MAG: acyltransferase [Actinomycetota bacterium]